MNTNAQQDPMAELLRARLKRPEGSNFQIWALLKAMYLVDLVTQATSGQAFFALTESRAVLKELGDRVGDDLIDAMLAMKGGTTITATGIENVPKDGPVVIGSTHPIGTFDFLAHAGALLRHRPDLKAVAGRETERFLGPERVISVDFDRSFQPKNLRQLRDEMIAHLEAGHALLVFGSGKVPDMANGLLFEPPWKAGITHVSRKTAAPIVPASTNMRNSRHYYRTRKWARRLSGGNAAIGREVASLRYASELLSKLGGSYEVVYGPAQAPGTAPEELQKRAESLVPGLYHPAENHKLP